MAQALETATRARDPGRVIGALFQLTKPGVTRMVLVTTGIGAILAPGRVELGRLALTVVATAGVVAAANSLNMYLERDVDARMDRTRLRPLPANRIAPEVALWFGVVLALFGITALTFWVNPLTGLLAALAISIYVLAYTPLKRVTPFALHVGAIPGAIPPLIGWASVTGGLSLPAVSVFAILLVWQIPHFLAIAIFRQSEYAAAGLAVYPAVRGLPAAKRAVLIHSVLLLAVSLLPALTGLGTPIYLGVAAALGVAQVVIAVRGFGAVDAKKWARTLFYATIPYLLVVYGTLALTAS
ncbi:MAG: protoheme IX farnesyltransferase [Polyangiaceae bacterium]|nr:protoheme IX farnesyltransferase [Polyangiaceae bacterium]